MLTRQLSIMFIVATITVPSIAYADAASAEKAIRSELKVKDMLFQPNAAVRWQIGVLDDGSKRWGYAMYLCGVL